MINTGTLRLKAKVKGLSEAGCWARRQKNKNVKELRAEWWRAKREVGGDTRHHLIAYGLLRGLPYGAIERRHAEGNAPSASIVHAIIQEHGDAFVRLEWTMGKVRAALCPIEKVAPLPPTQPAPAKGLVARAVDYVKEVANG